MLALLVEADLEHLLTGIDIRTDHGIIAIHHEQGLARGHARCHRVVGLLGLHDVHAVGMVEHQ